MALACGGDLGFETLDAIHEEMGRLLGARSEGGVAVEPPGEAGNAAEEPSGSVQGLAPQPDWERERGAEGATAEVGRSPGSIGDSRDAGDGGGGDDLVLFTYPLLVDEGRLSEGADELKAALGDEAFVELHPSDAGSLGLADGARATVRTDAGLAELPVRVTEHVAAGAAFVPFNQPDLAANTLFSGAMVTRARIEPVEEAVEGSGEPAVAAAGGEA
jgi:hypothetical protein